MPMSIALRQVYSAKDALTDSAEEKLPLPFDPLAPQHPLDIGPQHGQVTLANDLADRLAHEARSVAANHFRVGGADKSILQIAIAPHHHEGGRAHDELELGFLREDRFLRINAPQIEGKLSGNKDCNRRLIFRK